MHGGFHRAQPGLGACRRLRLDADDLRGDERDLVAIPVGVVVGKDRAAEMGGRRRLRPAAAPLLAGRPRRG